MIDYQKQDHGIYLWLNLIQFPLKKCNMPTTLTGGLTLLGLSTNIVPIIFGYVALCAI